MPSKVIIIVIQFVLVHKIIYFWPFSELNLILPVKWVWVVPKKYIYAHEHKLFYYNMQKLNQQQ